MKDMCDSVTCAMSVFIDSFFSKKRCTNHGLSKEAWQGVGKAARRGSIAPCTHDRMHLAALLPHNIPSPRSHCRCPRSHYSPSSTVMQRRRAWVLQLLYSLCLIGNATSAPQDDGSRVDLEDADSVRLSDAAANDHLCFLPGSPQVGRRLILHDMLPRAKTLSWELGPAEDRRSNVGDAGVRRQVGEQVGELPVQDCSARRRLTALVNGWHNSGLDVVFSPEQQQGQIELPQGWSGADSRDPVWTFGVGLISGRVEMFLCPEDYHENLPESTQSGGSLVDVSM